MLRLAVDENLREAIVAGLRRRLRGADLVRVQDVGLGSTPDPVILAWAANTGRVVVTHDQATMFEAATKLLDRGEPMAGLIIVPMSLPTGSAIDDLEVIVDCSDASEWANTITFLPL